MELHCTVLCTEKYRSWFSFAAFKSVYSLLNFLICSQVQPYFFYNSFLCYDYCIVHQLFSNKINQKIFFAYEFFLINTVITQFECLLNFLVSAVLSLLYIVIIAMKRLHAWRLFWLQNTLAASHAPHKTADSAPNGASSRQYFTSE
jgi:hypothetical protein